MIDTLPPPETLARLTGPGSTCVVSYQHTDAESGDVTSARCGGRYHIIARDYHGDSDRGRPIPATVQRKQLLWLVKSAEYRRRLVARAPGVVASCPVPSRSRHVLSICTSASLLPGRDSVHAARNGEACAA